MSDVVMEKCQIEDEWYFIPYSYTRSFAFDPAEYGIQPFSGNSVCPSGFFRTYGVEKDRLILQRLYIELLTKEPPAINGVFPTVKHIMEPSSGVAKRVMELAALRRIEFDESRPVYGEIQYEDVGLPVGTEYTGSFLLVQKDLDGYYTSVPYNPGLWAFVKAIELVFEEGRLVQTIDHSEVIEQLRNVIASASPSTLRKAVEESGKILSNSLSHFPFEQRLVQEYLLETAKTSLLVSYDTLRELLGEECWSALTSVSKN